MSRLWRGLWRRARRERVPALIHIPKTGGTYVRQCEGPDPAVLEPLLDLGHVFVTERRRPDPRVYPPGGFLPEMMVTTDQIRRNLVFVTVRNPFAFFVSYAGHAGGWTPPYVDPDHYDWDAARRGFDYLLNTIADRDEPWPCRKFLFFQMFCESGELIVDWVTRNETLDDDLQRLAQQCGAIYRQRCLQRVGRHNDYRSYYSDQLVELVHQIWGRELALFGYRFEGLDAGANRDALLVGPISAKRRQVVRYEWAMDRMTFHGDLVPRQR